MKFYIILAEKHVPANNKLIRLFFKSFQFKINRSIMHIKIQNYVNTSKFSSPQTKISKSVLNS